MEDALVLQAVIVTSQYGMSVLILVVMEDALVQSVDLNKAKLLTVLILVVMEDALVQGMWFSLGKSPIKVLILVVMEDALVLLLLATWWENKEAS